MNKCGFSCYSCILCFFERQWSECVSWTSLQCYWSSTQPRVPQQSEKKNSVLQSSPPIFIIAVFWFLDRKIEILLILLQVPIGKMSFYSTMEGNNWIKKVLVLLDCVRCFGMFLSTLEASSLSGVCPVSSFTLPGCVWRSFYREAVGFLVLGSLQAGASVRNVHLLFCLLFFLMFSGGGNCHCAESKRLCFTF